MFSLRRDCTLSASDSRLSRRSHRRADGVERPLRSIELLDAAEAGPLAAGLSAACPAEGLDGDSGDPGCSVESADATPCPVAIAAPIPSATANPPTRPTYAADLIFSSFRADLANIAHDVGEINRLCQDSNLLLCSERTPHPMRLRSADRRVFELARTSHRTADPLWSASSLHEICVRATEL